MMQKQNVIAKLIIVSIAIQMMVKYVLFHFQVINLIQFQEKISALFKIVSNVMIMMVQYV